MLTAIAIIPSAPVLVPQLAGTAAAELTDLRNAVSMAVGTLPRRWLAIGLGTGDDEIAAHCAGSFGGFGADVRVALSAEAAEMTELPLPALITAWVRTEVAPTARADVRVFAADHTAADALGRGQALRSALDDSADRVGVLVVADGANTLTPAAPGGHDPDSVAVQTALDDALAAGDTAALAAAPASIPGRVAWQVLAGLASPGRWSARELYRGAPFGVGYFVGVWQP